MGNTYTDAMSLHALATNAELSGGNIDVSGLGPTYRTQAAEFLRELADRIEKAPRR